jgi:hypothetical protein
MAGTNKPDRTFKTTLLFWHKGIVRRTEQRRIAELLAKPIESRIFESLPAPTSTDSALDHVCWVRRWRTPRAFFLFVPRLQRYNVEDAYELAKAESDGQYSPHTAFRNLDAGDAWAAVDFVNEFGPLELLDESEPRQPLRSEDLLDLGELTPGEEEPVYKERCVWVDVDEFWNKQKRFAAVANLWESRESPQAMTSALCELAMLPVDPPIGAPRYGRKVGFTSAFPWRDSNFHQWVRGANTERRMAASAKIINAELNLQAHEMEIKWTCSDPSRQEFQIVPSASSLWPAIWHLFAKDTSEGLGWRVCPHCSKLFYPKRKDSYFCEPKYQKLHAANRWWNEHSEEELDKRRKERAVTRPTRNKTARNRSAKGRK